MRSIKEIEQRTQRYFFEDGIWELGFGGFMLLLSTYYFLVSLLNLEKSLSLLIPLGQILVIFAGIWLTNWFVRRLKERITYPRTGYLKYRRRNSKPVRKIILGGLIGMSTAGLVGLIASLPAMQNWISAAIGLLLASMCLYLAYRFSLLRFVLIGLATLVLGFILSLLPGSNLPINALFFGSFSLFWLISGGLALAAYLRDTQPQEGSHPNEDSHE